MKPKEPIKFKNVGEILEQIKRHNVKTKEMLSN